MPHRLTHQRVLLDRWQHFEQVGQFRRLQWESRSATDTPELKRGALLGSGLLGDDQHSESGRTHERDLAEIDDQALGLGGKGSEEMPLKRGSGEHVGLPGQVGHHDRVLGLHHGDPQQLRVR